MSDERTTNPAGGRFPVTRRSVIAAACSPDPSERQWALERIVSAYWKPVYKYIRLRWRKSTDEAKDLTQEFFMFVIDKDYLGKYDPARARLRTYLRTCVDGLVVNSDRAARRLKRGGETVLLSLDYELAEGELAGIPTPAQSGFEEFFEKEWVRSLFSLAVEQLGEECRLRGKVVHFQLFERYDLDESGGSRRSYQDLARDFDLRVTDVTNYLAYARREFRRTILRLLREMTATEEEFRREARSLLGIHAD